MTGEMLWFYEMLVNSGVDAYSAGIATAFAACFGLYLTGRFVLHLLTGR